MKNRLQRLGTSLFGHSHTPDPLLKCLAPALIRTMASEATLATHLLTPPLPTQYIHAISPTAPPVLTTIYSFPALEPLHFASYPASHLDLPLRRDILHKAVIFEGDGHRQGTASTKWRDDVHGSGRKLRPQKGTGKARLGDRGSPMLRGGGVAFGPHPRDFATRLPRKMYDLAWRTALSYRYRRGELVVCRDGMELQMDVPRWASQVLGKLRMGNADGRSMIVTKAVEENLYAAVRGAPRDAVVKTMEDVDVKDLLEMGRVVIEKGALDEIFKRHVYDLGGHVGKARYAA